MAKLNLAILDSDARYLDNLSDYIAGHYRHRFNLTAYTDAELFQEYARRKDSNADILLVAAEDCGDWRDKLETGLFILLTRGGAHADGFCVNRYNGADRLVSDILNIYADNGRLSTLSGEANGGRENRIITILSAEGGSGKTSFAIALSSHFSRLKLQTLYINLDYTGAGFLDAAAGNAGGLSDIVYAMRARPDKLGIKLEALGRPAPGYGFYFYVSPVYPMDIDEILPADIETLIARLRGAGIYDRIVVDTHSGLSLRNRTLAEHADGVFIVANAAASGIEKLFAFKEQLGKCFGGQADDIYKRCHIILNSLHTGGLPAGAADDVSTRFTVRASVIPHSTEIQGDYGPGALASPAGGFCSAVAEIAQRS